MSDIYENEKQRRLEELQREWRQSRKQQDEDDPIALGIFRLAVLAIICIFAYSAVKIYQVYYRDKPAICDQIGAKG